MGSLTVVVGPVTGETTFNNTAGANVIKDLVRAYPELGVDPDTATNQEIMDAYIAQLRTYTIESARGYREAKAKQEAEWEDPDMGS